MRNEVISLTSGARPPRTRAYEIAIERCCRFGHASSMKKRILAVILWFYAGWTLGSIVAWTLGVGIPLGPIAAVVGVSVVLTAPQFTARPTATV